MLEAAVAGGLEPRRRRSCLASRRMPRQARKPCSGCGRAAQDHVDQAGGVGADRRRPRAGCARGSSRDSAGASSACARRRWCGRPRAPLRRWLATRLPLWKSSTVRCGDPRLDLLAEQAVRHRVVVLVDLDVVVEADPAALPLGVVVGLGRQRLQRRPVELARTAARRLTPSRRIGRSLRSSSSSRIAALSSASEKKRRWRSRARIQRSTTWTPTSTLALSRGLSRPRRHDRRAVVARPCPA